LVALTPFLWPALAAATASEMVAAFARELAHLAAGEPSNSTPREPRWTTPNRVALELPSMRLREFSADDDDIATLVCAPLALHDATLTDFAPGHSLVAALQMAGLRNLFVTDWRSASPDMRFFSIDSYLADLNVAMDQLGGCANLVGVCQGGWMALVYAARYPGKVRGLVLAGAPVDINAGESELSRLGRSAPASMAKQLVDLGDGRVRAMTKSPTLETGECSGGLEMPPTWACRNQTGPSNIPRAARDCARIGLVARRHAKRRSHPGDKRPNRFSWVAAATRPARRRGRATALCD